MKKLAYAALASVLLATGAQAAQIDSAISTLSAAPGVSLIDFEGQIEGTLIGAGVYSGVTFSQPDGGRPQIDNDIFLFGYAGSSGVGVLTGSTEGGAPFPTVAGLIATFATPQSAVEAFLGDEGQLGNYTVFAFGAGNVLLDSFVISGPNRYVGFSGIGGIQAIQFGPSSAFGDAFAIDDLRSVAAPTGVPEPTTWATMLLGFFAIGFAMRAERQRRTVRFAF